MVVITCAECPLEAVAALIGVARIQHLAMAVDACRHLTAANEDLQLRLQPPAAPAINEMKDTKYSLHACVRERACVYA